MFWRGQSVKFWAFSGPGDTRWGFGLPGVDFGAPNRAKVYFLGSKLGWFGDAFGVCFRGAFWEGLWITFLTILGWFQAPCWGRFRHIFDTKSEPAQIHEKLCFCCYLLYFRHVPDPENDAISKQFHVFVVVFFKALFWDPHFSDFGDLGCPLEALSGHF